MSGTRARTLDDDERRRIGAKRLASALDRNTSPRLQRRRPHHAADRGADRRQRWDRGRTPSLYAAGARHLLPLLAALPDKLGSNAALCAAVAGWGVGLVLSLVFLEVVRW